MEDNNQEILKLINIVKTWSDHSLPIEKRIELLAILNKFLVDYHENNRLFEFISLQCAWRKSSGIPIPKA